MKLAKLFLILAAVVMLIADPVFAKTLAAQKSIPDALTVIHSRKSVRQYTGEPASKDDLITLVKAGMAAPTAVDKRPWAFVIITDKEALIKLAEKLPYSKMIVQAGSAVVVCGVLAKALPGEAQAFWIQDCSAATENILLAAEALGLGAVWTGMYPSQDRVSYVQSVLGIPNDVIPLNIIAVGHPTGAEKPKNKFDETNIHWNKW